VIHRCKLANANRSKLARINTRYSTSGLNARPLAGLREAATVAVLIGAHTFSAPLAAQQQLGGSIKVGETDLHPEVRIEFSQSDNAFRTSDTASLDATRIVVSPRISWIADRRLLELRATYQGNYAQSSIDNPTEPFSDDELSYTDHSLQTSVAAELSKRLRVNGSLGFRRGHDDPGTNFSSNDRDNDVRQGVFNDINLGGRITYGVEDARGNVSAGINVRSYAPTNLAVGDNTSSDFLLVRPYGVLSLRISPDTRWVTELRFTQVDNEIDSRDRSEIGILTGLSLAQTRRLSGLIQVGASDISRDVGVSDSTELIAEGELVFEPADFSRFSFNIRRAVDNIGEGFATSSQPDVITTQVGLGWRHSFSSRIYHVANVRQTLRDQDCPGLDSEAFDASYEFNVLPERWFEVGAGVRFDSREFTDCPAGSDGVIPFAGEDYDRTEVSVHIRVTL